MKKRLLCLFLCMVMVLSVILSSCSEKTDEEAEGGIIDDASESAITLSMWVVCEKEVSSATAAAVSKALNAVTNAKFKTQLVINWLTEDEYRDRLEAEITAYEASLKSNLPEDEEFVTEAETETGDGEETVAPDETQTNEFGMTVIKYPDLLANQVDIIYIAGEDMYVDFIEKGWLSALDTELASSSKKLREYISGTLLSAAKHDGETFAIPNNRAIGQYNYMLLNKELMEKYNQHAYWEQGMIDGFYNDNLYSFLNLVYQFEDDVIPVDASYKDCLDLLAHYWYFDAADYSLQLDKFSLFGYHYQDIADLTRGSTILGFESLFENEEFAEDYIKLNEFRLKDYFRTENDSRKQSAVKFVNGDATILSKGEYVEDGVTYYPVIVGYPTATSEDIYGNMFGVCSYTQSVSRSMEIVTYLNTNPDFRNMMQYGVEYTNYRLVENSDGTTSVYRLNEDYMMDIYATGNTFITYPDPKDNMAPDIWESGKEQNRNSLVDPLLGFDLKDFSMSDSGEDDYVSLDKDGYNVSFTTGYSKELISQNATLAKWLKECDAQGKSVYAFKTQSVEGANKRTVYYIYNNNVAKSTKVTLEEVPIIEEVEDPKTGDVEEVQTGLDIYLNYADQKESSDTAGYELTVVTVDTKKNSPYTLQYKANGGAATAFVEKELDTRIAFDFLNTKHYSINVYNNLTMATLLKNATMINWLTEKYDHAFYTAKKESTYIMTNEKDLGNGQKEVAFVVFRTGYYNETFLEVQPTGTNKNLVVNFNFSAKEDYPLDETAVNYIVCYISVVADSDVKVSYGVSLNGDAETVPSRNVTKADPSYDRCGTLDTDLVKFMQEANDLFADLLEYEIQSYYDAYHAVLNNPDATYEQKKAALQTAMTSLKALVDDMSKIMSTKDESLSPLSDQIVYNVLGMHTNAKKPTPFTERLSAFLTDDKLTKADASGKFSMMQFHRNVRAIASKDVVQYDGQFDHDWDETRLEDFVYFDSPYTVYYAWMTKYGYLPESAVTEDSTTDTEATA